MITPTDYQELLDYRRPVARIYAGARGETAGSTPDHAARSQSFRSERDALLKNHPQSPLSETDREHLRSLKYFDYDPSLRLSSVVDRDVEPGTLEIALRDDGPLRLQRVGKVRFGVGHDELTLTLFCISGYGGGVLVPFKDLTSGQATYGGGRHLLDSIKHADLGSEEGRLILDFNYAYDPSCAYNPRWHCPLSPQRTAYRRGSQRAQRTTVARSTQGEI